MENESGKSSELGGEPLDFGDETDDSTQFAADLMLFPEWTEPEDEAAFADL